LLAEFLKTTVVYFYYETLRISRGKGLIFGKLHEEFHRILKKGSISLNFLKKNSKSEVNYKFIKKILHFGKLP
jgi:hypothetical protein